MRRNSSGLKRLGLILLHGSLIASACHCAPQSIKKDSQGVELLPNPRFGSEFPSPSRKLVGKSFISPKQLASTGEVASVIQFHEGGKLSEYDVTLPGITNSNSTHSIGFYDIENNRVETAIYFYDGGLPGYRYARGAYELNEKGDRLIHVGQEHGDLTLTSAKFKVTRKWRPAT